MANVIQFTPKQHDNPGARANSRPNLTFYCTNGPDQPISARVLDKKLFFANSTSSVPQVLDDDTEDGPSDFRALIGVGSRVDMSGSWEAFESFRDWLYTGVYDNKQIMGTHIDAYLLAATLQSHRFGNAVMQKILADIPQCKYDGKLADIYRTVYRTCGQASLLRKLYFQTAVFWGKPLGLEAQTDAQLIQALTAFKTTFCACRRRKPRRSHGMSLSNKPKNNPCACEKAPWLSPHQFFIED